MKTGAVALTALLAGAALAAQDQQPPRPTFKSSVDLVPVDVSVVDRSGRPVNDLASADFTLTVDGRPRRIASAEFIAVGRHAEAPAATPFVSSNAPAVGGRLIALVIDHGNISAGGGKLAIDAAKKFVAGLNRADRVALYSIPGAGPRIDFTANHALVGTLLDKIVGTATRDVGPHNIGISEVFALERGDQRAMANLLDRECPGFRLAEEIAACRAQLVAESRALHAEIRARTSESLIGLRSLMEHLAGIPSPKTMVLISEGLLVDRATADLSWAVPLAARAQLAMYVLQIEPPLFDAANPRVSATGLADIDIAQQGLAYLTGYTRGDVFRVSAGADFAFRRISLEMSGYYLLSFEPEPSDRDGRSHKIRIAVPGREGVLVRARSEFIVDRSRTATLDEQLGETLRSPLLATDISLQATTYSFWDPERQKLRLMIAADADRSKSPGGPLALAYALVDEKGGIAATDLERALETPVASDGTQSYAAATLIDPGVYTLKIAVMDERGKRGSVEYAFRARMESAGQVRIGGPLIATRDAVGGRPKPAVSGEVSGDQLHTYVELSSEVAEQLANASGTVEIVREEEGRVLEIAPLEFPDAAAGSQIRVGVAALSIGQLPPGDYLVRVVVNVFGRKAGQVTRPVRIRRAS